MKLTGAEILIKELEQRGVTHVFGYPGGAAINIFDALLDSSIHFVLTRHEQAAVHMADGYSRASGKPGVVLVTSGPGALNTVTGLLTAKMDSVPIFIISGQTNRCNLGKDAFQEADVFGTTMSVVKHNELVLELAELPAQFNRLYSLATSGRPGPVILDIPKDVSAEKMHWSPELVVHESWGPSLVDASSLASSFDKGLKLMAHYLNSCERPLLLIGHGAVISGATEEVESLSHLIQAPVTNTLLGKGCFSESHDLSLGMLGMHGTGVANYATTRCDVLLSVGCRFDDRINGKTEEFCPGARILHIDIDPTEIGRIVSPDAFVCGDAKEVLRQLIPLLKGSDLRPGCGAWLTELEGYKNRFPIKSPSDADVLSAPDVIEAFYKASDARTIVTTDVGQHQMWAAQFFLSQTNRSWLSSGGAGTMGFGFPAALGAQMAHPDRKVLAIVGDGGFQMSMAELATAVNEKLPVKILVIDNACLGMVRQWQDLFFDQRESGISMDGNPDFIALAAAYGVKGFFVCHPDQLQKTAEEAMAYQDGPCLIHAVVQRNENVFPMIPAGQSARSIVFEKPESPLDKPTGST